MQEVLISKPRVAVCMEYPMAQMGGVEVLVRALVDGLSREFAVILVSDDDEGSLRAGGWDRKIVGHIRWCPREANRRSARTLAAALIESNAKMAHFHFGGTYEWLSKYPGCSPILFTARRIPCVVTNHLVTAVTDGYCNPVRPLWFKLSRLPIAWASRLHVLSHSVREFTVSRGDCRTERRIFFPLQHRIRTMYHSILDETEPVLTARREKVILNVGTIGERKGQRLLVEAFALLADAHPEWRLRFIGRHADPAYSADIKELVRSHRLERRIEFAGQLSDAEVVGTMRTSAIFAMPSLSEGLGLSLQEAMFRGCVCVGSEVGGIPDLILHERTGLLTPVGEPRALAGALHRLISDSDLRLRLSREGRRHILEKGMTRQAMVRRHTEIYLAPDFIRA